MNLVLERSDRLLRATDRDYMYTVIKDQLSGLVPNATELLDLRVTRVFPQKRDGFAIQYELQTAEKERHGAPQLTTLWGQLAESSGGEGAQAGRYVHVPELNLTIPAFPFDPRLTILERLMTPGSLLPAVTVAPSGSPLASGRYRIGVSQVLSYRLERRCVLRVRLVPANDSLPGPGYTVVAKVMRPSRILAAYESSLDLASQGFSRHTDDGLTVPEALGADLEHGVLYMETVPGVTLHDALETPHFAAICEQAGSVLLKLHRCASSIPAASSADVHIASLANWVSLTSNLFPRWKPDLTALLTEVTERADEIATYAPKTRVHGDFFDKQVMYGGNRTALLDWQADAVDDPASDIGNFLAHLRLRVLQHPNSASAIKSGGVHFAKGYADASILRRPTVLWWQAVTLTRLTCIYALRPRWRRIVPELLTEATRCLQTKGRAAGRRI